MPKVSVILTTHGEGKYLNQAIASVLAQTFTDFELIIAKDGPSEMVHPYKDWRIKPIHFLLAPGDDYCRFARTINYAFNHCKGDLITYLCHDDLYLPWRLELMLDAFNKNPKWNIVFGVQALMNHDEDKSLEVRIGNPEHPSGTVDHSNVIHRRECFQKAGGWDESAPMRFGDAYFWKRLIESGYKFNFINEVLDIHRFNTDSVSWKEDHKKVETERVLQSA